jgi:predicted transcriptional regulator
MGQSMRASEVMVTDVVVAAAGATSSEVAALMRVKNISVVPVVDNPKDRHYMGTISDRDIVARCVGAGHDPTDCSAADHARTDTPVVKPETELKGFKLVRQLDPADHHVRANDCVLNGDKKVVGFISRPEDVQGIVIQ